MKYDLSWPFPKEICWPRITIKTPSQLYVQSEHNIPSGIRKLLLTSGRSVKKLSHAEEKIGSKDQGNSRRIVMKISQIYRVTVEKFVQRLLF